MLVIMKAIRVCNTVKIYRRCRKDIQRAYFIEGNIMLSFLVEKGICTEDAECNLGGDIEILILFEKNLLDYVKR